MGCQQTGRDPHGTKSWKFPTFLFGNEPLEWDVLGLHVQCSHLPDMTVITPVFMEGQGDGAGPSFFVASRGHHADVGGIAPGSMPPLSKTLEEVRTLFESGGEVVTGC